MFTSKIFFVPGKSIVDDLCWMISAAKSLALNPKDPPTVCHIFVKDVESAFNPHWGFTTPGFPLFETI
ncbi:hypothetical protein DAPPUDRAFT_260172 [Daphnia pulex]|uniref:Uncharacterized protein n=1 Tax=Daphnia pulex TaxID=6669 RepID=E9HIN0_DAPPU|nr:hypothetical protein DAPPUDRAFT_260172 [Daphnia pulex]|eukprot:EFX68383.1 hypothetical protein DAPPUDRAFT_260172 [Daphnia pulex]